MNKCIKTNLRRKLGRSIEFFFAVEIAIKGPTGRPHVHGEILLTNSELKNRTSQQPMRDALHMINNYSDDLQFKKRAIRLEMKRCDTGWAGYTA